MAVKTINEFLMDINATLLISPIQTEIQHIYTVQLLIVEKPIWSVISSKYIRKQKKKKHKWPFSLRICDQIHNGER